MTNLHTSPELLTRLRTASKRRVTAEEIQKQRVSYVIGSLGSQTDVTREKVQKVLNSQEGKKSVG
jgi:hypothetical protein